MTWWTLLKQFTNFTGMEHLLEIDTINVEGLEQDETFESVLNELDNSLGQYATVERPISLHFTRAQFYGSVGKIKELTSIIRRMGTLGNLIIRGNDIELSREIDNINYSFNERVYHLLEKRGHYACIYLNTNLNSSENIGDKGYPRICLKPPEGANESLGDWIILAMSSLEQYMQVIPGFQFFLEDVELWRRWGANGENLEDGLTENMPDFDKFRAQAIESYERGEGIGNLESKTDLLDKLGWQYFTDGIFQFHSTYWTPVERGQEYSNRTIIPR